MQYSAGHAASTIMVLLLFQKNSLEAISKHLISLKISWEACPQASLLSHVYGYIYTVIPCNPTSANPGYGARMCINVVLHLLTSVTYILCVCHVLYIQVLS